MLLSALLGEDPPELPVRRLVRLAALFGVNENQARVALSRMRARGDVTVDAEGTYSLAGRHLGRASRLATGRRATTGAFDGRWHLVVVTAGGEVPAARRERRRHLVAARLGELRDGTWVRPANLEVALPDEVAASCRAFLAEPPGDPAGLAATVFDLAGWAARARDLMGALARSDRRACSLAQGFELDAEVLRHLQRDPLVPGELLGDGWPGPELRDAYEAFHARYRARLAAAHRAAAAG